MYPDPVLLILLDAGVRGVEDGVEGFAGALCGVLGMIVNRAIPQINKKKEKRTSRASLTNAEK